MNCCLPQDLFHNFIVLKDFETFLQLISVVFVVINALVAIEKLLALFAN